MERNNSGQLGIISNRERLQIGIQRNSTISGHKRNFCKCQRDDHSRKRSQFFIRKKCYRNCFKIPPEQRFLQYAFSGTQKDRGSKTGHKFKTPKQISQEATLQNGHISKSIECSSKRRLGIYSGFERRILSYTNIQETPKISQILCKRSNLPIQNAVFWSDSIAKSLDKNCISSSRISERKVNSPVCLSRRLASTESKVSSNYEKQGVYAQSSSRTGIYSQCREISVTSSTRNNIHRNTFQFDERNSVSNSREVSKNARSNSEITTWPNFSQAIPCNSGYNSFCNRIGTECSFVSETNSITSAKKLATKIHVDGYTNTMYTSAKIPSELVVTQGKFFHGSIASDILCRPRVNHGFVKDGLGSSHWESNSSGDLVENFEFRAHKLPGVGSSFSCNETFSSNVEGQASFDQIRQYDSSSLLEQTRGDQIRVSLHENKGNMVNGYSEQDSITRSPYTGGSEYNSRRPQSENNSVVRMVSELGNCTANFQCSGPSDDRFVCDRSEQTMPNLLFMGQTSKISCSRCSVNQLGENVCICIPTILHDSQNTESHEEFSLRNNSDLPIMEKATLLPNLASDAGSMSNSIADMRKPIESEQNISFRPKVSQSSCMEIIDQHFQAKGFSENARKLLSASWRSGTRKDYSCKFRKFSSWCHSRQIDPYSASLTECANFLSDLYDEGLKYNTIAGYRSMLSSVLPSINNIPVGQHPNIIRILKGVFNGRPPEHKLIPEWDLRIVLQMLKEAPFEPMNLARLKYVTWKLVFLIAITSFRRCSDLQSLCIGELSVNIQKHDITFKRHGLSKQDRQNHQSKTIFIPTFKDNKLLDPKRTLFWYLKRTDSLRGEERKLFLSYIKPHRPISAQTISKWIVNTIKKAYKMRKLTEPIVKGHSTRAIGPSWAIFKGARMVDVMKSADWSRDTTFTKFYMKEVSVDFLKC